MRVANDHKHRTLVNALSRFKRVCVASELLFRTRQLEVISKNYLQGTRYFEAMRQALQQPQRSLMDVPRAVGCSLSCPTDSVEDAVQLFISEPAQRISIGEGELGTNGKWLSAPPLQSGASVSFHPTVGELAWGAFSFGKLCGLHSLPVTQSSQSSSSRNLQSGELSLQDLSVIECAVRYMESNLDYPFMGHLTEAGATMVHQVTMMMVTELSIRVDTAIVAAARLLTDPEVGGDVDHCCSLLRRRQFPAMWAARYYSN